MFTQQQPVKIDRQKLFRAIDLKLNIAKIIQNCDSSTINSQNEKKETVLHYAISKDNLEAAKALLNYDKIKPDIADKEGNTPLHLAASKALIEITEILSLKGHKSDIKNESGKTPLHNAVISNEAQYVKKFLEFFYPEVDIQDNEGETPLYHATKNNNKDIVQSLLQYEANPNLQDISGATPLHHAVNHNATDVINMLLADGAKIDVKDNAGQTPIYFSAAFGHLEAGKFLLDKGANPNIRINSPEIATPLEAVLEFRVKNVNKEKICKEFTLALLHNDKIDLTKLSSYIINELIGLGIKLDDLLDTNHVSLIKSLLANKIAIINPSDNDVAISARINKLLQKGINKETIISSLKFSNVTPELEEKILLDMENIDIYAKDKNGHTALHKAVFNGEANKVKYLIEKGANTHEIDKNGCTPLHLACTEEVAEILLNNGANINSKSYNNTAFSLLEIVVFRIDSLNSFDQIQKHQKFVNFLLARGANITTSNEKSKLSPFISKLLYIGISKENIISSLKKHNAQFDEETKIDIIKYYFGQNSIGFYRTLDINMDNEDQNKLKFVLEQLNNHTDKNMIAISLLSDNDISEKFQTCLLDIVSEYDYNLIGSDYF